jgi:hypothetical protein
MSKPWALRDKTLRALARDTNTPIEAISDLYEEEVAKLTSTSRVKRFISIIASRRVRQRLLQLHR